MLTGSPVQLLLSLLEKATSDSQSRPHIRQPIQLAMSRNDYGNSVMVGLPASTLSPLQRVQNAAAHAAYSWSQLTIPHYSCYATTHAVSDQWNYGSSLKLLYTTFSTTVPLVSQRSCHFLLQWSSSEVFTKVEIKSADEESKDLGVYCGRPLTFRLSIHCCSRL